jgi:non-specific serine/threonine protein kinase
MQVAAAICSRLDGVPLAIELAAARVDVMEVGDILAQLEESFGILTDRSASIPSRHQTLEATFEWSYQLLTLYEQELLQRLSVFEHGFSLEDAHAVCADSTTGDVRRLDGEIVEGIASLVRKSLIFGREIEGPTEFRMPETVGHSARARLRASGSGSAETQRRHVAWCVRLAKRLAPSTLGGDQIDAFRELDLRHANLKLGIRYAI